MKLFRKKRTFIPGFFIFLLIISLNAEAGLNQVEQAREVKVDELLSQADMYYLKGEYNMAIGCYLEAVGMTGSKINLSRAYFGLSLTYFYLRDTANSAKWLRKVFEVDPKKEISPLFYPQSYYQLFKDVQEEMTRERRDKIPEARPKAEETPPQKTKEVPPEKTQKPPSSMPPVKIRLPQEKVEDKQGILGGRWEVKVHTSLWSLDPVKGWFDEELNDRLGKEIGREVSNKLQASYPALSRSGYTHSLAFDSGGSNLGLEVRYYSRGREGTFSVGFSLEKTAIRLSVDGTVRQEFKDGSYADVVASGKIETGPFSTNISFRWDASPKLRVAPYLVFGFGFAPLKGHFSYSYTGNYHRAGAQWIIEDSGEKTFEELAEENELRIPDVFLLLQLSLGLKVDLAGGFCLRTEAGIWDGFILRAGLAYRF